MLYISEAWRKLWEDCIESGPFIQQDAGFKYCCGLEQWRRFDDAQNLEKQTEIFRLRIIILAEYTSKCCLFWPPSRIPNFLGLHQLSLMRYTGPLNLCLNVHSLEGIGNICRRTLQKPMRFFTTLYSRQCQWHTDSEHVNSPTWKQISDIINRTLDSAIFTPHDGCAVKRFTDTVLNLQAFYYQSITVILQQCEQSFAWRFSNFLNSK